MTSRATSGDRRQTAVAAILAAVLCGALVIGCIAPSAAASPAIATERGSTAPSADAATIAGEARLDTTAGPAPVPTAVGQVDGDATVAFQEEIDPDSVRLTVSVEDDGTARWRLEYWTELNDDNETEAFEELRDDVAANPEEYVARFANRTNRTVESARSATGREMRAGEFGVEAAMRSLPQEYGVLTYTFAWHGFAVADGGQLRIGDAIEGFYLNDRTRLVVEWPAEYALVEATPEPDERRDRAVLWRGTQTDFVSGEPRVLVDAGGGSGDGGVGTDDADSDDGTAGDGVLGSGGANGIPLGWIGGALALIALVGGGIAVLRRGRGDAETAAAAGSAVTSDPEATSDAEVAPAAEAATGGAVGTPDGETTDDGAGTDGADAGAAIDEAGDSAGTGDAVGAADDAEGATGDADDAADDGPPPELLSNEERVRRLLAANGGRMRQQEVVAETGWTEAKTSQVVSEMREAGTLESFRLGRENVLKLPDEDGDESDI